MLRCVQNDTCAYDDIAVVLGDRGMHCGWGNGWIGIITAPVFRRDCFPCYLDGKAKGIIAE